MVVFDFVHRMARNGPEQGHMRGHPQEKQMVLRCFNARRFATCPARDDIAAAQATVIGSHTSDIAESVSLRLSQSPLPPR
jgi:hypothetical protein